MWLLKTIKFRKGYVSHFESRTTSYKKNKIFFPFFYGINYYITSYILGQTGINENKKGSLILAKHLTQFSTLIEKELVTGENLKRMESKNINLLSIISAYRGIRHKKGLPTRGQRTRTNAQTSKRRRHK